MEIFGASLCRLGSWLFGARFSNSVETDTENKGGIERQEASARIANLKATTDNQEVQNGILKYEKEIKAVQANVQKSTQEEQINNLKLANSKLEGEAKKALTEGKITEATYNEVVKQAKQTTIEQGLRIALIKQQTANLKAGETLTQATNKLLSIIRHIVRIVIGFVTNF